MKLPDFTHQSEFNTLRSKMGANLVAWNAFAWKEIDSADLLERLNSIEGIDVAFEEIEFARDGTFEYHGRKVLVYIRDQYYDSRGTELLYRYHVANCKTIAKAFESGRQDRYVVSSRTDGRFLVNIRDLHHRQMVKKGIVKEMFVCKNCLMHLSYNGYSSHTHDIDIHASFSLNEFFDKYGGSRITRAPKHTDLTAPEDEYSADFAVLAALVKKTSRWICSSCKVDLSSNHKYLHVHHRNGLKGDNSLSNLVPLCIRCHANQPGHEHMRSLPEYKEFNRIYPHLRLHGS